MNIEKDYKLFAETGLSPHSSDIRLSTFMPNALKEMDAPEFELTIVDARTGQFLFRSNDVNNAWDGTNPLTGQKLQTGDVAIWKVVMKNNPYITVPIAGDITIVNR